MDEKDKKGFSGFSGLISNINSTYEPITVDPKKRVEIPSSKRLSDPQNWSAHTDINVQKHSNSSAIDKGKNNDNSKDNWTIGIVLFTLIFIFICFYNKKIEKNDYHNSLSQNHTLLASDHDAEFQASSKTKTLDLQYTKPISVDAEKILSTSEIRWCLRESIHINTMESIVNTDAGIDEFNRVVDDYNNYCGGRRYQKDSQKIAENNVESHRGQIIKEATQQAKKINQTSSLITSNESTKSTLSSVAPLPTQLINKDINERFKVTVKTKRANIRKSPERKNNILGTVKQGEQLTVIDIVGDYYLVSTSLGDVFIHSSTVHNNSE